MRKKIVAGNWKMNFTPQEAHDFVDSMLDKVNTDEVEVVFCVPYVDLKTVQKRLKGSFIKVGAQNMHYLKEGAYTGEISGEMLAAMEIPYVIIGHSERRAYYNETDETVNLKVAKALALNITPILCVGESLEQRDANVTNAIIGEQTVKAFQSLTAEEAQRVVIAYEPIWAIGTGRTATKEQANDACAHVRSVIRDLYDAATADAIHILYGGSVTADNAAELFTMPHIDGGLVGGASLKPAFERIVHFG